MNDKFPTEAPGKEREPMKVNAWIQMGCERREITFDVTDEEIESVGEEGLELCVQDMVLHWISCRYGW